MPVRPFLRLSWLTLQARLRSAGYLPWLLLAGWLLISASQEPRFLRRYGLFLIEDSLWSGCLAVLLVLVHAEARLTRPRSWAANLLTVVGLGGLMIISGLVLEAGSWDLDVGRCVTAGLDFILVWGPLAILAATARQRSWRIELQLLVVLLALVLGSIQAASLRSSPLGASFLSSASTWAAAVASVALSNISSCKK